MLLCLINSFFGTFEKTQLQIEHFLEHLAKWHCFFCSKKPDFLKQEIYGNLILYNFGIFLANEAALEKQKQQLEIEQQHQSQNKYHYQVDFSSALRIARKYFWRDSRTEKDIIHLMIKYVHAVKEELRQFSRPLRGIGAVHFAFR